MDFFFMIRLILTRGGYLRLGSLIVGLCLLLLEERGRGRTVLQLTTALQSPFSFVKATQCVHDCCWILKPLYSGVEKLGIVYYFQNNRLRSFLPQCLLLSSLTGVGGPKSRQHSSLNLGFRLLNPSQDSRFLKVLLEPILFLFFKPQYS